MGRFINADGYASTGQGLLGFNMFAYCLNNPAAFADPYGTFSKNHAMIRRESWSSTLIYGEGQAISISIYNTTVYIDAYMTFQGDLTGEMDIDYFINSIKHYWEGTYSYANCSFNVFVNIHTGESSGGNTILVNVSASSGRSYYHYNPILWKKNKEGKIQIYYGQYANDPYNWSIAHEFGHAIGIVDFYTLYPESSFRSIMNLRNTHALVYDVIKAVRAFQYNSWQTWYNIGGM